MAGLATRFAGIRDSVGPLCVGVDPSSQSLVNWGLDDAPDGALEMSRTIVAAAVGRVGIIKPQVAYFERFGASGFTVLETLIAEATEAGLCVIADAKRGDIGDTMEAYADSWLGAGPLASHAVTANPYLGFGPIEPAFIAAEKSDATVFVLAATSNPDSGLVQHASTRGISVAQLIVNEARQRSAGKQTVGVVIGATRSLVESRVDPETLEGVLVLAPGFGTQGASLGDLGVIFGQASNTVIPTVSRSILRGGSRAVGAAIDAHRQELGL